MCGVLYLLNGMMLLCCFDLHLRLKILRYVYRDLLAQLSVGLYSLPFVTETRLGFKCKHQVLNTEECGTSQALMTMSCLSFDFN